jgi:hypothetical protein
LAPAWWGLVWHDYMRCQNVAAPIPLNVVIRAAYLAYGYLRNPFRWQPYWERREQDVANEAVRRAEAERQALLAKYRAACGLQDQRATAGSPA